jgi:3-phenylpropionate/trans-cinnamate dioxygenase ferredoxin reductase subunit
VATGRKRIVVVGAGQAGGHAALALRKAAPAADIVLLGDEAYPPYERPPLSKSVLIGTASFEKTFLKPIAFYEEQSIDLRLNQRVVGIDRKTQRVSLDGGPTEAYDALILTMGSRSRRLAAVEEGIPNIFYLHTIDDARVLQAGIYRGCRMVVVGAGLIGLEVAAAARSLGCEVVIVESLDYPLKRVLAAEVAQTLVAVHAGHGVAFRFNTTIESISRSGSALNVATSSGSIETDVVVVGIGAIPNAELAAESGLCVQDGVLVDEFGRSSDAAISAAGDITRHYNPLLRRHIRLESWQNAQNQAIAVGTNVGGGNKPYAEIPWFWSDQYNLNLQVVGCPQSWDELVWRGDPASLQFTAFYLHNGRVVGANALNNPRDIRVARMLIERQQEISGSDLANTAIKLADFVSPRAAVA